MGIQKKRFTSIEWYLFILAMLLEGGGIALLILSHESICVQAYEMSTPVMVSLQCNLMVFLGDIVYVFVMIFMRNLGKEPLTIMYNLIMGLVNASAGSYFIIMMTYCGNIAQYLLLGGACCGIVSGVVHIINGCMLHWLLPREEL